MSRRSVRSRLMSSLSLAALLVMSVSAFAAEPVGHLSANAAGLSWQIGPDNAAVVLTITGPNDFVYSHEFASARSISLRLQEVGNKLSDGTYLYEMRIVPRIPGNVRNALAAARAKDDDAEVARIQAQYGLTNQTVQSGAFTILNGSLVNSDAVEPGKSSSKSSVKAMSHRDRTDAGAEAASGTVAAAGTVRALDVVTADDAIIQGSLCVGLDCVDGESFGFDTIRLKENNDRIKFDDTSTSAGFPNVDWQLTANDSGSGGANKFSIEDITNAKVPFTVTAAAPTNSIFVASSGKVGFGNSSPGLNLHITATDTPAIRQEQTNGGGFTAQTWDIGGNEANWFVRDLTGGSKLPFRIRPGAPTSSIDIAASGKVGVGTASPTDRLHVFENADANSFLVVENPNTGTSAGAFIRAKSDTAVVNFQAHGSGRTTISRFGQTLGGWSEMLQVSGNGLILGTIGATPLILGTNSTARMTIDSAGSVTIPGNLTVTGVKNFAVPDPADAKKALYYTALEGPEAGTYYRGTAKTVNGEVVIELPGYFARLTESEKMTVQLTPVGAWGQLYVAQKSPEKLVVKVAAGTPDLNFDFLVQGVRKGYLNYEVERHDVFPVK